MRKPNIEDECIQTTINFQQKKRIFGANLVNNILTEKSNSSLSLNNGKQILQEQKENNIKFCKNLSIDNLNKGDFKADENNNYINFNFNVLKNKKILKINKNEKSNSNNLSNKNQSAENSNFLGWINKNINNKNAKNKKKINSNNLSNFNPNTSAFEVVKNKNKKGNVTNLESDKENFDSNINNVFIDKINKFKSKDNNFLEHNEKIFEFKAPLTGRNIDPKNLMNSQNSKKKNNRISTSNKMDIVLDRNSKSNYVSKKTDDSLKNDDTGNNTNINSIGNFINPFNNDANFNSGKNLYFKYNKFNKKNENENKFKNNINITDCSIVESIQFTSKIEKEDNDDPNDKNINSLKIQNKDIFQTNIYNEQIFKAKNQSNVFRNSNDKEIKNNFMLNKENSVISRKKISINNKNAYKNSENCSVHNQNWDVDKTRSNIDNIVDINENLMKGNNNEKIICIQQQQIKINSYPNQNEALKISIPKNENEEENLKSNLIINNNEKQKIHKNIIEKNSFILNNKQRNVTNKSEENNDNSLSGNDNNSEYNQIQNSNNYLNFLQNLFLHNIAIDYNQIQNYALNNKDVYFDNSCPYFINNNTLTLNNISLINAHLINQQNSLNQNIYNKQIQTNCQEMNIVKEDEINKNKNLNFLNTFENQTQNISKNVNNKSIDLKKNDNLKENKILSIDTSICNSNFENQLNNFNSKNANVENFYNNLNKRISVNASANSYKNQLSNNTISNFQISNNLQNQTNNLNSFNFPIIEKINNFSNIIESPNPFANSKLLKEIQKSPQILDEYFPELLQSLKIEEKLLKYNPINRKYHTDVSEKMRLILVSWLTEVHKKFRLLDETLYLTVHIIDSCLHSIDFTWNKSNFQLLGVSALLLACKYEEIYFPELNDFYRITDKTFSISQIIECEFHICKILKYCIFTCYPIRFLELYRFIFNLSDSEFFFCKLIVEISIMDSRFLEFDRSLIALASVFVMGRTMANKFENFQLDFYKELGKRKNEFKECARLIGIHLDNSLDTDHFKVIKERYIKNMQSLEYIYSSSNQYLKKN